MNSIFTVRIKELRLSRGKTQAEIAESLGILRTTYGEYERGKIIPPMDKINMLAEMYNVSVDYLIGNTNESDGNPIIKMDVCQALKTIIDSLRNDESDLTFDEKAIDNDSRELLINSIESTINLGKMLSKRKD